MADSKSFDMLTLFHETLNIFLQRMAEVFDDCEHCARLYNMHQEAMQSPILGEALKLKVIVDWHENMSPYYETCQKSNVVPLLDANIGILKEIDFKSKWAEICENPVSVKNICASINKLNQTAAIYNAVPPKLMQNMINRVSQILEGVQTGKVDLSKLDVMAIASEFQSDMGQLDVEAFFKNTAAMMATVDIEQLKNNEMGIVLPDLNILSVLSNLVSAPATETETFEYNRAPAPRNGAWRPSGGY